jgi:hypothetical protein
VLNYDGVQLNSPTARMSHFNPVLARLHSIVVHPKKEIFTFSNDMPVFCVGYYFATTEINPEHIVPDILAEFTARAPHKNPEDGICLDLYAVVADSPAMSSLKGTTRANGYYGCHRCTQQGITLTKIGGFFHPSDSEHVDYPDKEKYVLKSRTATEENEDPTDPNNAAVQQSDRPPIDSERSSEDDTDGEREDDSDADPTFGKRHANAGAKSTVKKKAKKKPEEVKNSAVRFLIHKFERRTDENWEKYQKKDVSAFKVAFNIINSHMLQIFL